MMPLIRIGVFAVATVVPGGFLALGALEWVVDRLRTPNRVTMVEVRTRVAPLTYWTSTKQWHGRA